jgi:hypothetical protein
MNVFDPKLAAAEIKRLKAIILDITYESSDGVYCSYRDHVNLATIYPPLLKIHKEAADARTPPTCEEMEAALAGGSKQEPR